MQTCLVLSSVGILNVPLFGKSEILHESKCVRYSVSLLIRKPNHLQATTVRLVSIQLQKLFGLECNYVILCTLFSFRMLQSLCIMQKDWNYLLQTLIMHSKLKILRQVCFYFYVFSVTVVLNFWIGFQNLRRTMICETSYRCKVGDCKTYFCLYLCVL